MDTFHVLVLTIVKADILPGSSGEIHGAIVDNLLPNSLGEAACDPCEQHEEKKMKKNVWTQGLSLTLFHLWKSDAIMQGLHAISVYGTVYNWTSEKLQNYNLLLWNRIKSTNDQFYYTHHICGLWVHKCIFACVLVCLHVCTLFWGEAGMVWAYTKEGYGVFRWESAGDGTAW